MLVSKFNNILACDKCSLLTKDAYNIEVVAHLILTNLDQLLIRGLHESRLLCSQHFKSKESNGIGWLVINDV